MCVCVSACVCVCVCVTAGSLADCGPRIDRSIPKGVRDVDIAPFNLALPYGRLDEVKPGFAQKFAKAFEDAGYADADDVRLLPPSSREELALVLAAGSSPAPMPVQLERVWLALLGERDLSVSLPYVPSL